MSVPPASDERRMRGPQCETGGHCITCGDEATAMLVVRNDAARELALCAGADGARATVETALVGDVESGDTLLVHAGTAIARLPQAGAAGLGR